MTGGRASKGDRLARAVTQVLRNAGFDMSGTRCGHLVSLLGVDRRIKCKTRANGFRELYRGLDDANLLIIDADRLKPLAVIRLGFAIEIMKVAENSRKRVSSVPDAVAPAKSGSGGPCVMTSESKTPNALTPGTPVDGFDDTGDASASPLRGIPFHFNAEIKEANKYVAYTEPFPVKDRTFAVINKRDGWQKLAEGVPPEYLMREPGKLRPPRPHVDEKDYPLGFDNKPAHPFKWTQYALLVDTKTGELSTFWTNTTGGKIAFDELSDQIRFMRSMHTDAIAIIALESTLFPTSYGSKKARPHFRIVGYKLRDQIGTQNLLSDETKAPLIETEKPTIAEEMNDEIPDFGAKAAEAPKQKRSKK
jgi:hypothetical protein